ncbi:MAG: 4'-phosphopantetheinyl transferase family protein [Steroidobacterales bacterium]
MTEPIPAAEVARVLATDVVHVWRIPVQSPAAAACDFSQVLTPGEQARASRFTRAEDRSRFQVGRAATRCILGSYLGLPPSSVAIDLDRRGKPQLNASLVPVEQLLHFNVSHSGSWIVAAFARSFPVGIDIEQIRPDAVTEDLMAYFMSDRERRGLQSLAKEQQPAAFFRCWTSKEALLKGLGVGVTVPLTAVEVSIDPDLPAQLIAAPPMLGAAGWQLRTLEFSAPYAATLAVAAKSAEVVEIMIDGSVLFPGRPIGCGT